MEREIACFLKVTKTEYINDLTKHGNLYFSLAEEFRNRKRYGGKKYDSEEGSLSTQYRLLIDFGNNNFGNRNTIVDMSHAKAKGNECIYCLKTIYWDEVKSNQVVIPYNFFGDLIENDDWAEYSLLLIKNTVGFLDCVEQTAKLQDYTYSFRLVEYDDHSFECSYPLFSDAYAMETYFHKRVKFEEQAEYRLLLQNRNYEEFKLQIGTDFFTADNYKQIDNLRFLNTGKPVSINI